MKSIFILGASRLQVPAIMKAKEKVCMFMCWTMIPKLSASSMRIDFLR